LRAAYFNVPEHLRIYLLHDQDDKDWPLRVLITPIGESLEHGIETSEPVVQATDHQGALDYLHRRRNEERELRVASPSWRGKDDTVTDSPAVVLFDHHDGGHPYLANDYAAVITIERAVFPTVEHAYWAYATTDLDVREQIARAPSWREARKIGQAAPLRPDWNVIRIAVMTQLVCENFRQHPDLATKLIATGDGRLINGVDSSRYWGDYHQGRNWLILELVRAELVESLHT
jgi:predicted NAD-dependent protein-ADP-ribosyltransferase YbiA (DUF1768 family)